MQSGEQFAELYSAAHGVDRAISSMFSIMCRKMHFVLLLLRYRQSADQQEQTRRYYSEKAEKKHVQLELKKERAKLT